MANNPYKHWRLETSDNNIAWLYFDKAESGTNTLSSDVLKELDTVLVHLDNQPPRGLVILSGKQNGFIAGADVKEFTTFSTVEQASDFIHLGQSVFDHLEKLPFPTVALIHGFCLGGGLELALACRYRIAEDDPKTKLGLPEVKLGIHPGFGGTVRLPPLVGALNAMDLMLTGRTVSARAAKKIGLINYAVPSRHLHIAAEQTILQPPAAKKPNRWHRLSNHHLARPILANIFRKRVAAKAPKDHYPAPYAIIDLWVRYADSPRRMLNEERASVARLVTDETAKNLVRVFFLQERLKSLGDKSLISPKHVHVIGGGVMGGDIAAWCALSGFKVTVQDRKHETLARVKKRANDLYIKRLKVPRLAQAAMDRLLPDIEGNGLEQADIVIEAVFEDLQVKQNLFREIEPKLKPGALLATNTSSIPLEELAQALSQPQRLVGLHFFNPVAKMQLVEIVHGDNTDPKVVKQAAAFTRQIDRLPVPVKSSPGFLVNRILMPYLLEAVTLEGEGVPATTIDRAALRFGMPMGPIELADTVGLDICLHVAENLANHYSVTVPERLRQLVQAGKLGRKTGSGFYQYKGSKKLPLKANETDGSNPDITDRIMLRMLNEAVACLRETVVENADLLDAGIIFGTGFAPFRGGPMHYIEQQGQPELVNRLNELKKRYGERFTPDAGWNDLLN
jgi:3-hydroxyacyl-CoA dehydrogenase/enoyl-CoA hydratase/3-hydroxybutyryl-CoA epimerase